MTKVDNKFLEETWDVTGKLFAKVVEKIIPISNLDDLTEDNIERFVEWSKKRFFGDNKNLLDIICDEIRKEIYDYLKKQRVSEFAKSRLTEFEKNGLSNFNMKLISQENSLGDILLDFCRENNVYYNVTQEKELKNIAKDIELNMLNSLNNEKSVIQFSMLVQSKKSDNIINSLDQINRKIDKAYNELVSVNGDELDYYKKFFKPLCFHNFTRARVSMFDVFVMPEVEYKDNIVKAEDCAKDFLSSGDPLLLLLGQGGYGKTSFVCWISRNYRRITDRPVHIIRLRDYFANTVDEIFGNIVNKMPVKKIEDNAVIVLDGLDELCMAIGSNGNEIEYSTVLIKKFFELLGNRNDRRLIITSRNVFVDSKLPYSDELREFNKEYHYFAKRNFNLHIAVLKPLSNQLRRHLIENLAEKDSNISRDSYIYKYLNELDSETEDNSVFSSPFIVYLMCAAPNSNNNDMVIDEECINNRWLLFRRFFYDIYINPEYSENGSRAGMYKYRKELYSITCEIAFRMYKSQYSKLYFTRDEVQKIVYEMFKDKNIKDKLVDDKLIEYLSMCHSLSCYFDNSNFENGALEFVHNIVRDFFVCEYILRGLNDIYNKDMDDVEKGKQISYWLSDHLMYLPLYKNKILFDDNNIGQIYLQALKAAGKTYPQLIENSGNNDNLHYIFDVFIENGAIHKFNYDLEKINIEKAKANILINSSFIYMHIVKKNLNNNQKIKWFGVHEFGTNEFRSHNFCAQKFFSFDIIHRSGIKQISWYNKVDLIEYMKSFLDSADLSGVNLMYADLSGANLRYANLKDANLRNASLGSADLSGADLKHAYLPNAILDSTNLRDTIDLNRANLIGATYNSETMFPNEFDQENFKFMIYHELEAD